MSDNKIPEQHGHPSKRCALPCILTFGARGEATTGILREIDDAGARVKLQTRGLQLSGPVTVAVSTGMRYDMRVLWQKGQELGLWRPGGLTSPHPSQPRPGE